MEEQPLPYRGSIDEHLKLLEISRAVLAELTEHPLVQKAAAPTLLHADFHKRNIYVSEEDPTIITGIIDWQSTSIEPALVYVGEDPDFAALPNDLLDQEDAQETENAKKAKEGAVICSQTFDACLKGRVPKLRAARQLDDRLYRLFRYCPSSWRDSAAAFRQELIELSQHWVELGLPGAPPYVPTEQDLAEHQAQYADLNDALKLKTGIMRTLGVNSDGWVQEDRWDEVRATHAQMYQEWMRTAEEAEARGEDSMSVEKARKLWPFNEV